LVVMGRKERGEGKKGLGSSNVFTFVRGKVIERMTARISKSG